MYSSLKVYANNYLQFDIIHNNQFRFWPEFFSKNIVMKSERTFKNILIDCSFRSFANQLFLQMLLFLL